MNKRSLRCLFRAMLLLAAAADLGATNGFTRDTSWPGALPDGWKYRMVSNMAADSQGRIYVAHRGEHPVLVFDRNGKFLHSLGDDIFKESMMYDVMKSPPTPISRGFWIHGIHVDPRDNIWVTDYGRHVVFKFNPSGELLLTLGTLNKSGEDEKTFYQPSAVAVAPTGQIFVADGYGNSRIVKFSPEGHYIKAWGRKGSQPGEFNLPHGIAVDTKGRVYVAERLNNRVQVFDGDGNLLTQWADLPHANAIALRRGGGAFVGAGRDIIQVDSDGRHVEKIGDYATFGGPHGLMEDNQGYLYVADPVSDNASRPPRRFVR